jgi:hypothetical protein
MLRACEEIDIEEEIGKTLYLAFPAKAGTHLSNAPNFQSNTTPYKTSRTVLT